VLPVRAADLSLLAPVPEISLAHAALPPRLQAKLLAVAGTGGRFGADRKRTGKLRQQWCAEGADGTTGVILEKAAWCCWGVKCLRFLHMGKLCSTCLLLTGVSVKHTPFCLTTLAAQFLTMPPPTTATPSRRAQCAATQRGPPQQHGASSAAAPCLVQGRPGGLGASASRVSSFRSSFGISRRSSTRKQCSSSSRATLAPGCCLAAAALAVAGNLVGCGRACAVARLATAARARGAAV